MREKIPVFGGPIAGEHYRERAGSYAVIRNDQGSVLIVRTAKGYFLPGGGAEPGETAEQTLARELHEECGAQSRLTRKIGVAEEFTETENDGCLLIRGTFFEVILLEPPAGSSDAGDSLIWLSFDEASRLLHRRSQVWALSR
jgi:8-oxo-dGTP diphosphatase